MAFGFGLVLDEQLIGLIGHFDHWVSFAVFALSIDAAAVGASSKGLIEEPLYVLVSIGLLSPAFIFVGSLAKDWLTKSNGALLKFVEGSLFISIGIMIVLSHISGGF